MAKVPPSPRLMHLEAIRGIASVMVLFHHFALAFAPWLKTQSGLLRTPIYWTVNGEAAVYLFFMLSGLVLTRSYFRGNNDRTALVTAALKRLPRLAVPAGASTLLSALVLASGLSWHLQAGAISQSDWLLGYGNAELPPGYSPPFGVVVSQLIGVFFAAGPQGLLNTNLWTMRPELVGSLLCFAIVWMVLGFRSRKWIEMATASIAAIGLGYLLHPYVLPFAIGTLLAVILDERVVRLPAWLGVGLIVLGLMLISRQGYVSALVGAALIISASHTCAFARNVLSGSFGRLLGAYSFPIYLVHPIAIYSAASFTFVTLGDAASGSAARLFATLVVTVAVSVLAAVPFRMLEIWWVATLNSFASTMRGHRGREPVGMVH